MQWTVKYAPKSSKDLVGNKSNYVKLITWIKSYKNNWRTGKSFKHLAFLGGPPGIGKTSGILAIAKELNYEVIEFNASDQRNADIVTRLVSRASQTKPNYGFDGKIVLLDEVDGLSGNQDRGGLGALLKLAKNSAHPIICTANNFQNLNLRKLKTDSLFLPMAIPDKTSITNLLQRIASSESITVDPVVFRAISDNARGDLRAAVNDLENLAHNRKEVPRQSIRALSVRDSEHSISNAIDLIFGGARTLKQAHDVTSDLDVDYSMFLNYVVENIPAHANSPQELVAMFDKAASADLIKGRIKAQNWILLKYYYYLLSAGIRASKISPYQHSRVRFPTLLIALSRSKKVRNLRDSVALKLGSITHSSKHKVISSTLPYLRIQFELLFELFRKKELSSPQGVKIKQDLAYLQYQVKFETDELLYLFNDPLYDKPSKTTEKQQKDLINQLNQHSDLIQAEQVQITNQKFWENNSLAQHFTQSSASDHKSKAIKITIANQSKKASKSSNSQKKTSSLLKFTETDKNLEKKSKKKGSKSLTDFL